jgi:hypothetical protein
LCDYASHPSGAPSWRFSHKLAGLGVLGDLMSHAVDMAQYLLGPIVRVTAQQATLIAARPKMPMSAGTHFSIVENGELAPVENENAAGSLVRCESGLRGTLEASRVIVGPRARMGFEVHGTYGAPAWDFQPLNEPKIYRVPQTSGDAGYATVMAAPHHPEFAHFMPAAGNTMDFGDLKVIEAKLFLESIRDGVSHPPNAADALATARVIDAMVRSIERESWADVEEIVMAATPSALKREKGDEHYAHGRPAGADRRGRWEANSPAHHCTGNCPLLGAAVQRQGRSQAAAGAGDAQHLRARQQRGSRSSARRAPERPPVHPRSQR